ncbi:MAG: DUF4831 family protein [Bacteroidales bacterium]|nr:DUF4831 family protein [Bacteroidales bacterium]
MKPKLYITGIAFMFFTACNPPVTFMSTIKPLGNTNVIKQGSVIYALPKTILKIDVEARKTIYRKGPYQAFAEKYLGIKEGVTEDKEEWSISNIEFNFYEEIDPEHYYVIEAQGDFRSNVLELTREGLILSLDPDYYRSLPTYLNLAPQKYEGVVFPNVTMKKFEKEIRDTAYRIIETDTAMIRIPYLRTKTIMKTMDEKAKDAANFIRLTRRRKVMVLRGKNGVFPEGIAMETAVRELTRMEEEYLDLFFGKVFSEVYFYTFEFIPEKTNGDEPLILFRFSPQKGILPENDLTGRPITIEVARTGKTDPLEPIVMEQGSEEQNIAKLYYRVPDLARVQIADEENVLAKKKFLIYQFGKVLQLPSNFIIKDP